MVMSLAHQIPPNQTFTITEIMSQFAMTTQYQHTCVTSLHRQSHYISRGAINAQHMLFSNPKTLA